MKKIKLILHFFVLLSLSACGIKNYFPDKSKEYQFTTEIPELDIPTDLATNTRIKQLEKNKVVTTTIVPDIPPSINQQMSEETELPISPDFVFENNDVVPVNDSNLIKTEMFVELDETNEGVARMRIGDSLARSWRLVGKVLTRHAIEITKRNEQEYIYSLQYDPDFKEVEDGSIWDEVLFIFGSDPTAEQEYKIKLAVEKGRRVTEVFVLDTNDQLLSEGPGLTLLTTIYTTIKDDIPLSK